jgi:hypothetical protein
MFGTPTATTTPPPGGGRPQAGDVAKIVGNLTHVIVAGPDIDDLHVFYNGQWVMTGTIENIGVEILAPTNEAPDGAVTGVLTRTETDAAGAKTTKSLSLFPGSVELIAKNRRVVVICPTAGTLEGVSILFGTANEAGVIDNAGLWANGVRSLRIVVSAGLTDAKLVWDEDGREDNLLP